MMENLETATGYNGMGLLTKNCLKKFWEDIVMKPKGTSKRLPKCGNHRLAQEIRRSLNR